MPFEYLDRIVFRYDASLKEVLERFNETAIHTENSGFGIIVDELSLIHISEPTRPY